MRSYRNERPERPSRSDSVTRKEVTRENSGSLTRRTRRTSSLSYREELKELREVALSKIRVLENDLANADKYSARIEELEDQIMVLQERIDRLRDRYSTLIEDPDSVQRELDFYRTTEAATRHILQLKGESRKLFNPLPPKQAVKLWILITTGDRDAVSEFLKNEIERR